MCRRLRPTSCAMLSYLGSVFYGVCVCKMSVTITCGQFQWVKACLLLFVTKNNAAVIVDSTLSFHNLSKLWDLNNFSDKSAIIQFLSDFQCLSVKPGTAIYLFSWFFSMQFTIYPQNISMWNGALVICNQPTRTIQLNDLRNRYKNLRLANEKI